MQSCAKTVLLNNIVKDITAGIVDDSRNTKDIAEMTKEDCFENTGDVAEMKKDDQYGSKDDHQSTDGKEQTRQEGKPDNNNESETDGGREE